MTRYKSYSADELRGYLRTRGTAVWAVCRKGCLADMPLVPHDVRYPGRKVPLTLAMLDAVSEDGTRGRIHGDHGHGGWVPLSSLLFEIETGLF